MWVSYSDRREALNLVGLHLEECHKMLLLTRIKVRALIHERKDSSFPAKLPFGLVVQARITQPEICGCQRRMLRSYRRNYLRTSSY